MTSVLLLRSLKVLIEKTLENIELSHSDDPPKVFLGWLPIKNAPEVMDTLEKPIKRQRQPDNDYFPYVVLRLVEGEEEENDAMATVRIGIGIYDDSDEMEGYMNLANVIEEIKQAILKVGILDHKYETTDRIKWKIYEDQSETWPMWEGEMLTKWTLPGIQREVDFGD